LAKVRPGMRFHILPQWNREASTENGDQHSARVRYDEHQELDISESRYRERGYKPSFDELPWKEETENGGAQLLRDLTLGRS
jgi:hypothetical protein